MTVTRDNFPIRYCFEGKEYEVRYTNKGGLIMTGVKYEKNISTDKKINVTY
jgi:hypothetical protein